MEDGCHPQQSLTRYVCSDLCKSRLAEAFSSPSANGDQVGGPGVQTREHVVGFIPQFGHCTTRTGYINARVRGFNALIADL